MAKGRYAPRNDKQGVGSSQGVSVSRRSVLISIRIVHVCDDIQTAEFLTADNSDYRRYQTTENIPMNAENVEISEIVIGAAMKVINPLFPSCLYLRPLRNLRLIVLADPSACPPQVGLPASGGLARLRWACPPLERCGLGPR